MEEKLDHLKITFSNKYRSEDGLRKKSIYEFVIFGGRLDGVYILKCW